MGLPGEQTSIITTPPSPADFTDISTGFMVGAAPNVVPLEEVFSIDQFEAVAGARDPASPLWDAAQVFFREGGSKLYVSTTALPEADAAVEASLANFTKDLGPGQMAAPGLTTGPVLTAVAAAANSTGRIAILDAPDTAVAATITARSVLVTGQPGDQFSGMFAPWDQAPPLIPGGPPRLVPPSARIMGNIARNDASGLGANDPAAGPNGIAAFIQGLSQAPYTDADRATLNDAGVNVSRVVLTAVRTYGWRTLANLATNPNWTLLSGSRCVQAIRNQLDIMSENFVLTKLDGQQILIKKFEGAIIATLTPFWNDNDLFGDTISEAFSVDTGPAVNTPTTLANGELHARVGLKTSPFAEQVFIDVAKVPLLEAISV